MYKYVSFTYKNVFYAFYEHQSGSFHTCHTNCRCVSCCSMSQRVAVCCSVLQCVAVYRVAVCLSVLQCVAAWYALATDRVVKTYPNLHFSHVFQVLQYVSACCSALQRVAVRCSVLRTGDRSCCKNISETQTSTFRAYFSSISGIAACRVICTCSTWMYGKKKKIFRNTKLVNTMIWVSLLASPPAKSSVRVLPEFMERSLRQYVAVCCSVLQCVAVCCSV